MRALSPGSFSFTSLVRRGRSRPSQVSLSERVYLSGMKKDHQKKRDAAGVFNFLKVCQPTNHRNVLRAGAVLSPKIQKRERGNWRIAKNRRSSVPLEFRGFCSMIKGGPFVAAGRNGRRRPSTCNKRTNKRTNQPTNGWSHERQRRKRNVRDPHDIRDWSQMDTRKTSPALAAALDHHQLRGFASRVPLEEWVGFETNDIQTTAGCLSQLTKKLAVDVAFRRIILFSQKEEFIACPRYACAPLHTMPASSCHCS